MTRLTSKLSFWWLIHIQINISLYKIQYIQLIFNGYFSESGFVLKMTISFLSQGEPGDHIKKTCGIIWSSHWNITFLHLQFSFRPSHIFQTLNYLENVIIFRVIARFWDNIKKVYGIIQDNSRDNTFCITI